MTTKIMFLALSLSTTILGCADQVDPDPTPTKDEVRGMGGKGDDGVDDCAKFGWYGDGTCDTFCPMPDPDCRDGGPGGITPQTCADLGGQCLTSFQFPTSAPSCENEFNLVTAQGSCPQINQSCCVKP
jgi:hypothetical protein